MLTKKLQRKYLRKRNREWQDQLQTFVDSRDPEALHQLRVTLKKLQALAHFSTACSRDGSASPGAAPKRFGGLKKMFKQAGLIRDAGNHLKLLEKFHPASAEYKTQQHEVQTSETEKFILHIKQYRRQGKRAARRMDSAVKDIPAGCIHDWFALQLVSTGILLTGAGDDLHKARKQIKELLYVERLLPDPIQAELHLNRDYLDTLQEAIGQWHDAFIVMASWAGKDLEGSQAMVREYHEKEAAVRGLSNDFYLRIDGSSPG